VRLVDDLLDVSRITRGKISLHREPLSLHAVVSAAVELARPAVDRLSHVLTISHAQEHVRLEGDFARLVQVVSNLLTNAAKFTPAGGRITVTTQQTGDHATIRVRDSGVGIGRELQGSVFDLFVQGDGGLARTQGGLGIGLTLAKRIVELHQGTIEVRSEGVGRGSEFIVTLPALPASAQLARRQAPRLTGGSRPLRIMLVEDNPDAAESFTLLLELGGHEVRAAHEALEALRLVEGFVPDLAFVDVGLPGIDGYELATRLRAHPSCQSSVLVALTGYGRDEDKRRASEAGFDHHMTKPVDFEAVDHLLANVSAPAGGVSEERGRVQ
jgi:CheY-like chemotaxis protein